MDQHHPYKLLDQTDSVHILEDSIAMVMGLGIYDNQVRYKWVSRCNSMVEEDNTFSLKFKNKILLHAITSVVNKHHCIIRIRASGWNYGAQ